MCYAVFIESKSELFISFITRSTSVIKMVEAFELTVNLKTLLDSGKLDEAQNLVLGCDQETIIECGWEVVAVVANALRENTENDDFIRCCNAVLLHVAETGNTKEVLFGLLDLIHQVGDELIFGIFLGPLKLTLQRLHAKRGVTLKSTLDSLYTFISKLSLPESYNYEGNERLLLDLDPDIQKITRIIHHYLDFLRSFVEEVSLLSTVKKTSFLERTCYQRDIMSYHLLQILDHPLAYLDLSHNDGKAESSSRVCAEKVMNYLSCLKGDSVALYMFENSKVKENNDVSDRDDILGNGEVSPIAIATLAYLILKERLGNFPTVYSPIYLLDYHSRFIVELLSSIHDLVQYKGLHLFQSMLSNLSSSVLPKVFMETPNVMALHRCLINIMIFCTVKEYRQHALRLFKDFIEKFDASGRYYIILSLLTSEKHPGVRGLLLQLYNDNVHGAMVSSEGNIFLGDNLQKVLRVATKLPDDAKTDLLDESDLIMTTLNFLRYLVICDRREVNKSGIWDCVNGIKDKYLNSLRMALNLSRAHYKLELENCKSNSEHTKKSIQLQVGNTILPHNDQSEVLHTALLMFDMMESVLVRLEEYL